MTFSPPQAPQVQLVKYAFGEYDKNCPVVCMDEQPTQLVKETRQPIGRKPEKLAKYDYEYERNGTANNFMFTEPFAEWRKVSVRETKTRRDWAEEMHGDGSAKKPWFDWT